MRNISERSCRGTSRKCKPAGRASSPKPLCGLACEIVRSDDPCQPDIEHSPRSDTTEGTSQMTTSARVALWFAATLILVLCVLTALLIFPSRPVDTHSLRFHGYIVLPKVKNSGAL